MTLGRFLAILTLISSCCVLSTAQELAVRYYPEKSASAVGEPIFVLAEFTNLSSRTIRFDESPCLQSFRPVVPLAPAKTETLYGCTGGGTGGSCVGSFVELKVGERLLRRYLLPDGIEPNSPGESEYEAQREIRFYATDGSYSEVGRQKVSETFTVRAIQKDESQLRADYARVVADLQSPDARRCSMALVALTEHPQDFLEPVILKLSQKPATMSASIEGLKKLGTDQAKQRLAELTDSQYDESVRQPATTALAELGDPNYCAVMLHVVNLHQGYSSDIAARGAGLLCGETAISELVPSLSASPSPLPAYEIAYALGNTSSRKAVPVLIELLRNSDDGVTRAAREALYTLTHHQDNDPSHPDEYSQWVTWWTLQGKTAQIFGPADCPR